MISMYFAIVSSRTLSRHRLRLLAYTSNGRRWNRHGGSGSDAERSHGP